MKKTNEGKRNKWRDEEKEGLTILTLTNENGILRKKSKGKRRDQ